MKLIVETIKINGQEPEPCDFEACDLDASVRISCQELLRDHQSEPYFKTPVCTGHGHVVIAEAMVGL